MKFHTFFLLIIIQFSLIKSKCGFNENFPFEIPKKISTISLKNNSHPLNITFIYSIFDNQKELISKISKHNIDNIKHVFSEISYSFSKILTSLNSNLISIKNKNICGNKINNLELTNLPKIINTDLLIFLYFDEEITNYKSGICAIDDKTYKPIIALIGLPVNYKYYSYKSFFLSEMVHNMIHILGFNFNSLLRYGFESKYEVENFLFHSKKISFLIVLLTKNYYLSKETIKLSYTNTVHLDYSLYLKDIMLENKYNNLPLTKVTLSILSKSNWYEINNLGCNLIFNINNQECLYIGNICNYDERLILLTQYYIEKGLIKCLYKSQKKIIFPNLNIYQEYLFKEKEAKKSKLTSENNLYDYEKYLIDYPEIINIEKQELNLLNPSKYCKIPQRTVFFAYSPLTEINQNLSEYNITKITLSNKEKEYYVLSSIYPNKEEYNCLHESIEYNNIIRVNNHFSSNFIYNAKLPYLTNMFKYQKIFPLISYLSIAKKDNLVFNYLKLKNKYSKDFNYLPQTYIIPKDRNYLMKQFKNYTVNLDNLWLIKPTLGDQGRGIHLLESINDIIKCRSCIITKYISNPDLVNGKKYDIRMYLLVTNINPLIIYIYNDGLVRVATENYILSLETLKNLYIHLTNTSLNDKSKKFIINNDPEAEKGNTWTLHTLKNKFKRENHDFNIIMEQVKDFSIKTILSMLKKEIIYEHDFGYYDNNIFGLFGIDVLIDSNLRPWLIEVNAFPSLMSYTKVDSLIKSKLLIDMENILGIIPFNHINGQSYDKENYYNNFSEEKAEKAFCQILRPSGGFERAFPKKNNIDYYKKFFENISQENLILWDKLKNMDEDI